VLRQCPPLPFHRPSEPDEFLLGRLVLPTGQLVACDPVTRAAEARPFARSLPPGTYAVRLGVLGGEAAYVALMARPSAPVSRWELALPVLGEEGCEPQGFVVDGSTAAYLDVAGLSQLARRDRPDVFTRLLASGYADRPHAVVDLGGGGNLVAFGTGTDGRFHSYWGLDEAGAPLVLVTDLGVLSRPHGPSAAVGASEGRSNVVSFARRPSSRIGRRSGPR
jgi:hypothetical protein